jgi:uroporphyrinogen-III decarboxylase
MRLETPDRIPVAPAVVHYYPTRAKGISNRDAHYNLEQTLEVWKETTARHDWDAAPPFGSIAPARPLDILGVQQIKWPGGGLPDDRPFQWVEGEYMMQDEYDEALQNPDRFAIQKLWPRVATTLAPIGGMSQTAFPPLLFLSSSYTLPGLIGEIVSSPQMVDLLEKALELARETRHNNAVVADYSMAIMNLGYPLLLGAFTFTAFDWISDVLRGMRGVMLDMYQVPDKLLALIDMFVPLTIRQTVAMAEQAGIRRAMIPLHRGSAGFLSDEHYARFYWPSLKALVVGLIDADVAPVVFIEGDYTPRLKYLQELLPRKVVLHFDQVDRKKAKKMLGDTACFWGNVPASTMCVGTPQRVKDDVKDLIDTFGDNGGLIVDSTVGLPDESRVANVQALTDAVHEYGVC